MQRSLGNSVVGALVQRQPAPAQAPASTVGGSPYTSVLPGYSQAGDTCGAASLVTALTIWDREHWDPAQPNSRIVAACNLILTRLAQHGGQAVDRWVARPAHQVSSTCGGDRGCIRQAYEALRARLTADVQALRDAARQSGGAVSAGNYQTLGLVLYFLWHEGGQGGLTSNQIDNLQNALGLEVSGASSGIQSFDEIFTNPVVMGLQPDQMAQVGWFVNTGQQHAFLVGRLATGQWFLSDQGPSPAFELRGSSPADLAAGARLAASTGTYWLFTGTIAQYLARGGTIPGWTGVKRLGSDRATEEKARDLIPAGAFLGEVDASLVRFGSRITRDSYVSRRYTFAEARGDFSSSSGGGVIVEMPQGVFNLYTTSAVSNANVSETSLDASDSAGGLLVGRRFFHAWLILGTSAGRKGSWFQLY